jgi:hypothetical protein
MLPSLEHAEQPMNKPRILALEVRDKNRPDGPVIAQIVIERLNRQLLRAEAHPALWAMFQLYRQRTNWVIGGFVLAGVIALMRFFR